jgi:lauroyl/myristoyl acyltransferase
MADDISAFAKLEQPLSDTLAMLREVSLVKGPRNPKLVRWGAHHPQIAKGADWFARAWWGAAAGELVRACLYDRDRRPTALELVEPVDSQPLKDAQAHGRGVIVLTAHIGPPKFLMNWLFEQPIPLLVWTNTQDLPAWQAAASQAKLVDPRSAATKSVILVKSALHLRRKGALLGAADMDTGDRVVTIERLGLARTFSLGLPTLARTLGVPTVVGLALWSGQRITIRFAPLEPPDASLSDEAWNLQWLERSWNVVEPVLAESPENLRFLHQAVDRIAKPWGETSQPGNA